MGTARIVQLEAREKRERRTRQGNSKGHNSYRHNHKLIPHRTQTSRNPTNYLWLYLIVWKYSSTRPVMRMGNLRTLRTVTAKYPTTVRITLAPLCRCRGIAGIPNMKINTTYLITDTYLIRITSETNPSHCHTKSYLAEGKRYTLYRQQSTVKIAIKLHQQELYDCTHMRQNLHRTLATLPK